MMAIIIMRLKSFGTPALCIMTSLLASRQVGTSLFQVYVPGVPEKVPTFENSKHKENFKDLNSIQLLVTSRKIEVF